MNDTDGKIEVRATVKLQKLSVGQRAWVDPNDPYIASLLDAGMLYPVRAADRNPDWAPDVPLDKYEGTNVGQTEAAAPPSEPEPAEPPAADA